MNPNDGLKIPKYFPNYNIKDEVNANFLKLIKALVL